MNNRFILTVALAIAGFAQAAHAGGDPAAGQIIAEQTCKTCHGADGDSTDPQYPRLKGQHADYIVKALSDYKSGARKNPIMSGFAAGLSKQDQANVAAWFAGQDGGLVTPEMPRHVEK